MGNSDVLNRDKVFDVKVAHSPKRPSELTLFGFNAQGLDVLPVIGLTVWDLRGCAVARLLLGPGSCSYFRHTIAPLLIGSVFKVQCFFF